MCVFLHAYIKYLILNPIKKIIYSNKHNSGVYHIHESQTTERATDETEDGIMLKNLGKI